MQDTFNKIVMEHFQFLVDEYNFKIINVQDLVQYDVKAEGFIEYQSPAAFVTVTGEWYWNGVAFGRAKDARKFALSSELVHEYLSLMPDERKIICSPYPKESRAAGLLRASRRLQHEKREFINKVEQIDSQLTDHARWLRQYADPFLRGDFSLWLEIYEYMVSGMIGEHKRAGRSDVSLRYDGKDDNGKSVHIKQHVFQSSLDYLTGLREGG